MDEIGTTYVIKKWDHPNSCGGFDMFRENTVIASVFQMFNDKYKAILYRE